MTDFDPNTILSLVKERNLIETQSFIPFFNEIKELTELDVVLTKNAKSTHEKTRVLTQDVEQLTSSLKKLRENISNGNVSSEEIRKLEDEKTQEQKKLVSLLEKKTQSLEMKQQMKTLKEKYQKKKKISKHLTQQNDSLKDVLKDKQESLRTYRSEMMNLQLKLQEKTDILQIENEANTQLQNRMLKRSQKIAKQLNEQNEQYEMKMKEKRRKNIIDFAVKDINGKIDRRSSERELRMAVSTVPKKALRTFEAHEGEVTCVKYHESGGFFITGSVDSTVKVWDSRVGTQKNVLRGATSGINTVDVSSNGTFVLGGGNDNSIRIWNLETSRVRHTFTNHTNKVFCAIFSADSSKVISAGQDRTIRIFDLNRGYCEKTIMCPSTCFSLALSLENTEIYSGHFNKTVKIFDLRTGQETVEIDGKHGAHVTSVELSNDGTKLLTNCRDSVVRILDLKRYKVLKEFKHPKYKNKNNLTRAVFSPDMNYVAAGGVQGMLFIWNALTGKIETSLTSRNKAAINSLDWSPTGDYLATVDRKKKVTVWY
ncbi:autophagy-related 16 isoform f [Anaeramoeba flamelloides]|uniref:Autophagy-related 16 isoform f n=1 Tax=Anaeramoeba flamelloides TaxID=1746091 RepID=A0AAV7YU59_9EUKA|nr:autophagy-related 16 isoform f [Anaeramoeba flamelloides]